MTIVFYGYRIMKGCELECQNNGTRIFVGSILNDEWLYTL